MNDDIVPGFDDERDDSVRIRLQKIDDIQGCLVLSLTGYVDTYTCANFQARVGRAIEAGFTRLIFCLDGLNYLSSSGIGAFTYFLKVLRQRGGDLVLLDVQPKVYEIIQLLGFSQYFAIRESLDEAVSFFATQGREGAGMPFPRLFRCPICSRRLKAARAGRFRCPECTTILALAETGAVNLG